MNDETSLDKFNTYIMMLSLQKSVDSLIQLAFYFRMNSGIFHGNNAERFADAIDMFINSIEVISDDEMKEREKNE